MKNTTYLHLLRGVNLFERRLAYNAEGKADVIPVTVEASADRSAHLNNADGRKNAYKRAEENVRDAASSGSDAAKSKAKEVKTALDKAKMLEATQASNDAKKSEAEKVESANSDLLSIMLEEATEAPKKKTTSADADALDALGAATEAAMAAPGGTGVDANQQLDTAALEAAAKNAQQPDTTGRLNLSPSSGPMARGESRLQDVVPPGVVAPAAPRGTPARVASTPPAQAPEKKKG